ncbi:MAG: hypothetical protein IPH62_19100 [Ignavibacteriae bacterium]|nr:hypothetical protein [Ignavibacteriota bacterium]
MLYDGVAPRRFLDFYSVNNLKRKNKEGIMIDYELDKIYPKTRLSLQAIPKLEEQAVHSLEEHGLI